MKRSQILQWKQLVLVEQVANRIACGFSMAERQQDHLDLPWRPARAGPQKERERESKGKKEEERGRKEEEGGDLPQ